MEWTVSLIPPEFSTGPSPAESAWKATTADCRPIECLAWGNGTPASPLQLFVRVGGRSYDEKVADGGEPKSFTGRPRIPTFEELQEAIDHTSPAGAIFSLGAYTSRGRDAGERELPETVEWLGMAISQVGVDPSAPAARSSLIISPGGLKNVN